MRILQVHAHYRQAGGEDAVVEADRAVLSRAGHVVEQYIEFNSGSTLSALTRFAASAWNMAAQHRVASVIQRFEPDVLHVHNTWFALSPAVLQAASAQGIPTVMTVHNFRLACANSLFFRDGRPCEDCLHRGTHHAVLHGCYRGSRAQSGVAAASIAVHRRLGTWPRLVDRFVTLSKFAESRLRAAGVPAEKLLPGSNFVADPGPRAAPPSASRDVLFIGRISGEKGLADLVNAWRRCSPQGLRLLVIGDGPDRTEIEAVAPDDVVFLGRRSPAEVAGHLLAARAVVIPSTWYEGQPMVALEALAAGTPLMVSDIGGLPEVLGATGAGWLCPPGDPEGLAEQLTFLLNESDIDRRGERARMRYEHVFTPELAVPRLEAAYVSASNARRAAADAGPGRRR